MIESRCLNAKLKIDKSCIEFESQSVLPSPLTKSDFTEVHIPVFLQLVNIGFEILDLSTFSVCCVLYFVIFAGQKLCHCLLQRLSSEAK